MDVVVEVQDRLTIRRNKKQRGITGRILRKITGLDDVGSAAFSRKPEKIQVAGGLYGAGQRLAIGSHKSGPAGCIGMIVRSVQRNFVSPPAVRLIVFDQDVEYTVRLRMPFNP